MTITFDSSGLVWVASGTHQGIPYIAEGTSAEEAYNNAVTCVSERHAQRASK